MHVYSIQDKEYPFPSELNECSKNQVLSNVTNLLILFLGLEPILIDYSHGNYAERMKLAFSNFPKKKSILVVINFFDFKITPDEKEESQDLLENEFPKLIQLSRKNHEECLANTMVISALKLCKREFFIWFKESIEKLVNINSSKNDIKSWINGKNPRGKQFPIMDLITDDYCVAGFEADMIIGVGKHAHEKFLSRCKGQFIHVP